MAGKVYLVGAGPGAADLSHHEKGGSAPLHIPRNKCADRGQHGR